MYKSLATPTTARLPRFPALTLYLDGETTPTSFTFARRIGAGSEGDVYKYTQDDLEAAVKFAKAGAESSLDWEISAMKCLSHPNIVTLVAQGKVENTPYYVMPLAKGSLSSFLDDPARIVRLNVLLVIRGIENALNYLHERDIFHRDVKPENVLMYQENGDFSPCLGDFSFARRRGGSMPAGVIASSPFYRAPEISRLLVQCYDHWAKTWTANYPGHNDHNKPKPSRQCEYFWYIFAIFMDATSIPKLHETLEGHAASHPSILTPELRAIISQTATETLEMIDAAGHPHMSPRVDLFGLGCIAVHFFTGHSNWAAPVVSLGDPHTLTDHGDKTTSLSPYMQKAYPIMAATTQGYIDTHPEQVQANPALLTVINTHFLPGLGAATQDVV